MQAVIPDSALIEKSRASLCQDARPMLSTATSQQISMGSVKIAKACDHISQRSTVWPVGTLADGHISQSRVYTSVDNFAGTVSVPALVG